VGGRSTEVDREGAVGEGGPDLGDVQWPGVRDAATEQLRAALVRRSHPGEVARHRRLAREEHPRERVDVRRADHRVVAALVADRRRRRRRDPGRAERPGAVGRIHADVVLVREHDLVDRAEHRPGERQRVLLAKQVRPADRPDEERPPVKSSSGSSARDRSATA
jgi:hypothetical protein